MRLCVDESVDRQIVDRLRRDGHEVAYIAELDPGVSDDVVLATANEQRAPLLTADKDFGELLYRQVRISFGLILIRLAGLEPQKKADVVAAALRQHAAEVAGAFTVITPGNIRVRARESPSR